MACARGELYSLVLNSKMDAPHTASNSPAPALEMTETTTSSTALDGIGNMEQNAHDQALEQQQSQQSDIELTLQAAHIKNANYRFRITDQSKITQLNGFGEPMSLGGDAAANNVQMATDETIAALNGGAVGDAAAPPAEASGSSDGLASTNNSNGNTFVNAAPTPEALRLFRDVFPQDDLPQIPKYERLPAPCPQMEKIISIRRRMYDPTQTTHMMVLIL